MYKILYLQQHETKISEIESIYTGEVNKNCLDLEEI
jgi:hypothetical protein